ncbi:hypothetical protein [Rhizobium sp. AAP43]|uniref:hypothetical protein n=1 Tax=Rhizobium sp. AAP43 TaxID=1523420 RepID=UPI000ACD95DF|nr:hypothetical protein [Rhizobium sp. AAP43]
MLLSLPAATVMASEPSDPVKVLMRVAGWKEAGGPDAQASGYFDDTLLSTIYSQSFVEVYRLAQKTDELQDGAGYMTGYDVIIGGQDSCELEKVRIEAGTKSGDITPVSVYFDAVSCFGLTPDLSKPGVIFHVIEEGGRAVIDNFWNRDYNGGDVSTSVKNEYADFTRDYLTFRVTGAWPKE